MVWLSLKGSYPSRRLLGGSPRRRGIHSRCSIPAAASARPNSRCTRSNRRHRRLFRLSGDDSLTTLGLARLLTAGAITRAQATLHHAAQNAHHLRGILERIVVHAFLGLVDVPDSQPRHFATRLCFVQAVVHISHVLDFHGEPHRVGAGQEALGQVVGLAERARRVRCVVLETEEEGRDAAAVVGIAIRVGVGCWEREARWRSSGCYTAATTSDRASEADGR